MNAHEEMLAAEKRALRLSANASAALAVLGVVWGLLAASQAILFDGVYAVVGFLLAWLGIRASSLVEAGPTTRYPFGREALAPLVVAIQALVLFGTFAYAAVDAVMVILDGGAETAVGSALVYSVVTLAAVLVVRSALVRRQEGSDLVAAEVAQWNAAALFGLGLTIGFGLAFILERTALSSWAPFVDPALVLLAGLVIVPTPVRMLRGAFRELLEGAPATSVTDPIHAAVNQVADEEGLGPAEVRIGKLGRKLYVEVDWLVGVDSGWQVGDADRIRRRLMGMLTRPGVLLWLNVELHTDPDWDR